MVFKSALTGRNRHLQFRRNLGLQPLKPPGTTPWSSRAKPQRLCSSTSRRRESKCSPPTYLGPGHPSDDGGVAGRGSRPAHAGPVHRPGRRESCPDRRRRQRQKQGLRPLRPGRRLGEQESQGHPRTPGKKRSGQDKERYQSGYDQALYLLKQAPVTKRLLRELGTSGLVELINVINMLPHRNFLDSLHRDEDLEKSRARRSPKPFSNEPPAAISARSAASATPGSGRDQGQRRRAGIRDRRHDGPRLRYL